MLLLSRGGQHRSSLLYNVYSINKLRGHDPLYFILCTAAALRRQRAAAGDYAVYFILLTVYGRLLRRQRTVGLY